jgi:hypothetical protein
MTDVTASPTSIITAPATGLAIRITKIIPQLPSIQAPRAMTAFNVKIATAAATAAQVTAAEFARD